MQEVILTALVKDSILYWASCKKIVYKTLLSDS